MAATTRREQALAALAEQQSGLFTRRQALGLGYTHEGVARRLRAGLWIRVYKSIYRLRGVPPSLDQRYRAATLYGGPDSLLCGEPAGYKWGLAGCRPVAPRIVTPRQLRDPGLSTTRVREPLPAADRDAIEGIPVTSSTRTLIDLASDFSTGRLQHAFDSALRHRLTTPELILARLETLNRQGRRGVKRLQQMVDEALSKPNPHSGLERIFLWLLSSAGYPEPLRQFPVDLGWEQPIHIDFAYPDLLIGIETDGFEPHNQRTQWARDRHRDAALALLGWLILRFTRDDVLRRQDYVISTLAAAFEMRAAR